MISAAGCGKAETRSRFARGPVEPAPVTVFASDLTYPVFEVAHLDQEDPSPGLRSLDLARTATREALDDAGLSNGFPSDRRVGVCFGTTIASQVNDLEFYQAYRDGQPVRMDSVERFLQGNLAGAIQRDLGVQGPATTVVNACSSSSDAIGIAASWIRAGLCDIAIAGGADEMCTVPLSGFGVLGILAPTPCRPFDGERVGLNLGEGAGVLVLEAESSRRARGRDLQLSLAGYGAALDAHHLTAPHPDGLGLEAAIRQALSNAQVDPGEVAFVNAHGTATPDNDRVEARTLRRVFGPDVPFLSTKRHTGHTLGAAGGLEASFTALALLDGEIPASAGFETMDPEIGASPATRATKLDRAYGVSTSLAFGGNNAALLLCREGSAS